MKYNERVLRPVHCKTARKFLDAISPIGRYFEKSDVDEPWIFRGTGKDVPLVPSLYRKGKLEPFTDKDVSKPENRRIVERDLLVRFFDIADRRGLTLPDDSQQLRASLEVLRSKRGDLFVPVGEEEWRAATNALSLTALAQHYGLPTALLDWSRKSFIAAFFAAQDAYNNGLSKKDLMVVWAFYFPELGKQDWVSNNPIRVITAPTATNDNLRVQQGVFTCVSPFYSGEDSGKYRPMEDVVYDDCNINKMNPDDLISKCRLRKFTLPAPEASTLLCLLAKLDITPSAMYPGFASAVDDLRWEHRLKHYI